MVAILILGIVALFFVVNAFAQSASERLNCPSGALSIFDVQEGINVECVNALFATLTPTAGAPTDTPVPPSATPVPPSGHDPEVYHGIWNGPSEPFAGAPACQSMTDADCHWDHTHHADPSRLDGDLGPVGDLYGGQEISYPWQTFRPPGGPGNMENDFKHTGYKWEVNNIDDPLITDGTDCQMASSLLFVPGTKHCITKWRIQLHTVGGQRAFVGRIHSFLLEAEICDFDDPNNCGTIKTGGWNDFGILVVPYQGNHIPLPGDPNPITNPSTAVDPYRGHEPIDRWGCSNLYGANNAAFPCPYIWTTDSRYGYNQIAAIVIRVRDDWQGVDIADPFNESPLCADGTCKNNHSSMFISRITVDLTQFVGTVVDEHIDYSGYTDRFGNIVPSCSPLGMDCIPLELINVPYPDSGHAGFGSTVYSNFQFEFEYDVAPEGEAWIVYPY